MVQDRMAVPRSIPGCVHVRREEGAQGDVVGWRRNPHHSRPDVGQAHRKDRGPGGTTQGVPGIDRPDTERGYGTPIWHLASRTRHNCACPTLAGT